MGARAGTARRSRVPVPDIALQHDAARGLELVRVKTISFCESRYPSGAHDGVARRERAIAPEYLRKARALDRAFGLAQAGAGTEDATIGPIEAKYRSVAPVRGAVVGGFNEGSAGLYSLIADISAAAGRKVHSHSGLSAAAAAATSRRCSSRTSARWPREAMRAHPRAPANHRSARRTARVQSRARAQCVLRALA